MIKEINDKDLNEIVSHSENLILADFWAEWCGSCEMIAPILEELSEELTDKVEFYKINVDGNREYVKKHKIMSIPTLLMFKDKDLIEKAIGYKPKEELLSIIEKNI